jgi:hypothetical protein
MEILSTIPVKTMGKLEKLSNLALDVLTSSVESSLRRDYNLADKSENVLKFEKEYMKYFDSLENKTANDQNTSANIKLILKDVRRTVEHATILQNLPMN